MNVETSRGGTLAARDVGSGREARSRHYSRVGLKQARPVDSPLVTTVIPPEGYIMVFTE